MLCTQRRLCVEHRQPQTLKFFSLVNLLQQNVHFISSCNLFSQNVELCKRLSTPPEKEKSKIIYNVLIIFVIVWQGICWSKKQVWQKRTKLPSILGHFETTFQTFLRRKTTKNKLWKGKNIFPWFKTNMYHIHTLTFL